MGMDNAYLVLMPSHALGPRPERPVLTILLVSSTLRGLCRSWEALTRRFHTSDLNHTAPRVTLEAVTQAIILDSPRKWAGNGSMVARKTTAFLVVIAAVPGVLAVPGATLSTPCCSSRQTFTRSLWVGQVLIGMLSAATVRTLVIFIRGTEALTSPSGGFIPILHAPRALPNHFSQTFSPLVNSCFSGFLFLPPFPLYSPPLCVGCYCDGHCKSLRPGRQGPASVLPCALYAPGDAQGMIGIWRVNGGGNTVFTSSYIREPLEQGCPEPSVLCTFAKSPLFCKACPE